MNEQKSSQTGTKGKPPVRPYKRRIRNIFIHKPLQREFLFVTIGLFMIATLAISFVIHHTIREAVFGGGFRFGKISPYEILSDVSYDLVTIVSLILFATLIVLAVFGVTFLHRAAGPVYRFRQVFARLNRGEAPSTIKLREGDFFTELAEEINVLIRRIEWEQGRLRDARGRLEAILQSAPNEPIAKEIKEIHWVLSEGPENA